MSEKRRVRHFPLNRLKGLKTLTCKARSLQTMASSHLESLLSGTSAPSGTMESGVIVIQVADDRSEDLTVSKLAKAFFIATTKESEDSEDILPQVGNKS
jgi:hypothetical protein